MLINTVQSCREFEVHKITSNSTHQGDEMQKNGTTKEVNVKQKEGTQVTDKETSPAHWWLGGLTRDGFLWPNPPIKR